MPPLKTLNLHFSRLPQYRGASPMQYALLHGDSSTAISIFVLDELMDHGPIIAQEDSPIPPTDTFPILADHLAKQARTLLLRTLPDYATGQIVPRLQDHTFATITKIITKADGRIDWMKPAPQIYNQWRAYYSWPGIWTSWKGKKLKILECELTDFSNSVAKANPGVVLAGGLIICGAGNLKITQLQLEGKKAINYNDFLRGHPNFEGSQLI